MVRITALCGELFSLSHLARSKEIRTDNLTMRFFAAVNFLSRILGVTAVAGAQSTTFSTGPGDISPSVKWPKREPEYLTQFGAEDKNASGNVFTPTHVLFAWCII